MHYKYLIFIYAHIYSQLFRKLCYTHTDVWFVSTSSGLFILIPCLAFTFTVILEISSSIVSNSLGLSLLIPIPPPYYLKIIMISCTMSSFSSSSHVLFSSKNIYVEFMLQNHPK